jgi:hypothetical protein
MFEFSVKSYVINTINLSCAKILFPSVVGVFVGFSRIFLVGILIFKGLTARHLYKSFSFKGLIRCILHWFILSYCQLMANL